MVEREREWISRARRGDDQAFACLVEVYQVPVFNLCFRMLGEATEAEDAAQETFLRAYRGLKRYDPKRKFVTWILSIASHHCIDRLRRRRIVTLSIDDLLPGQMKPDPAPGPEAVITHHERHAALKRMLDKLGHIDRAAVILRYWDEMSYEEIAQSLTLSVSSVKSRLHRARRELAVRWQEQETVVMTTRGRQDEASAV
jgi:RNA polymerase sigma-70 factor (ECF subfamily)